MGVIATLLEACRQRGRTPLRDLRTTVEAILWRHRTGAPWRSIPPQLGSSRRAAQTFIRWAHLGVWDKLLAKAQESGIELGMVFLDGTTVRAHQKAAGACAGRNQNRTKEALGRSRGVFGTKACVIADSGGRAVAFAVAPGQAHELPQAVPLLARLPGVPVWVVADRAYSSHALREHIWNIGARPAIPPKVNEATVACPEPIYNNRNRVERLWARLKEWRAVATRYEKSAASFLGVLCLAATADWLRR